MKNITQKCHLCVLFLDLTFCKNLGFFISEHCELLLVTESRCRQVLPCFQIVNFLIFSWNTGTTGPKGKILFGYSRSQLPFQVYFNHVVFPHFLPQTLLRNHRHLFIVEKGTVRLRPPLQQQQMKTVEPTFGRKRKEANKKSGGNPQAKKLKPCWFYSHHPYVLRLPLISITKGDYTLHTLWPWLTILIVLQAMQFDKMQKRNHSWIVYS
jgi:hypothetical protein